MVSVRYMVNDVEKSVAFYTRFFDFKVVKQFEPMAILSHKDFRLWLAGPKSSAGQPMPNGEKPTPGGWNRFVLQVDDLHGFVEKLKAQGAKFRNEIVSGPGGQQILCEDPSGNVIELFQPAQEM